MSPVWGELLGCEDFFFLSFSFAAFLVLVSFACCRRYRDIFERGVGEFRSVLLWTGCEFECLEDFICLITYRMYWCYEG